MPHKAKSLLPKNGEVHLFLVGDKCYATITSDDLEDLSNGKKHISNIALVPKTKKDKERDRHYENLYS